MLAVDIIWTKNVLAYRLLFFSLFQKVRWNFLSARGALSTSSNGGTRTVQQLYDDIKVFVPYANFASATEENRKATDKASKNDALTLSVEVCGDDTKKTTPVLAVSISVVLTEPTVSEKLWCNFVKCISVLRMLSSCDCKACKPT